MTASSARTAACPRPRRLPSLAGLLPLCAAALVLALAAPARAREPYEPPKDARGGTITLSAELQNLFLFRNDRDFDRTEPTYNADGQTVGAFATMLTPRITWNIRRDLRIFYEAELGLNFWSKNNPDQQDATAGDVFLIKQRQIYGEGEFFDTFGAKIGYARFQEPTGLFVHHWIGMMQAHWIWDRDSGERVGIFAGQVPDQTYEGILVSENNFTHDIWVFGADSRTRFFEDRLTLDAAVTGLHDAHRVEQTRWLVTPSLRLSAGTRSWQARLDLALQAGQLRNQALPSGGESTAHQTHLAWALQAGGAYVLGPFVFEGNVLVLSPDDAHDGNGYNHAFLASGKNHSATLMLTEDEVRDWYDNIDERIGGCTSQGAVSTTGSGDAHCGGGFFLNRAGLMVADLKVTWHWTDIFRPALVVGVGTVLKPENAAEGVLLGVETDLLLELVVSDYLSLQAVGGLLVPGPAAAALINTINPDPKDPIGMAELSFILRY